MKSVTVSQIAAMAQNRVIGVQNSLPWHIPEDLKFFREKTLGKIIIMGRKTFDSVGSKPMPKRLNVIVTRQKDYHVEGAHVFNSCEQAIQFAKSEIQKTEQWGDEIMICGGEEIYRQTLPYTNRIYLTVVEAEYSGDAKFPEFDLHEFRLKQKQDHSGPVSFSFQVYEKTEGL